MSLVLQQGIVQGPPVCIDSDHAKAFACFLDFWGLSGVPSLAKPPQQPSPNEDSDPFLLPCMGKLTAMCDIFAEALVENRRKLEEEREALDGARQAWRDEMEFIDRYLLPQDSNDDIVYVSAMGYKLATHRGVMRSVKGSMLASLFDQQLWNLQQRDLDKEGNYYLEVSSYSLSKILDLLRQRAR